MLLVSIFSGENFITIVNASSPTKSLLVLLIVDLISGSLLALGFFLFLVFLSPPFPFFYPTCATGWHDIFLLSIAGIPLGLRYVLVRKID